MTLEDPFQPKLIYDSMSACSPKLQQSRAERSGDLNCSKLSQKVSASYREAKLPSVEKQEVYKCLPDQEAAVE